MPPLHLAFAGAVLALSAVHLLAGREGSSIRVASKNGRERTVTP